MQQGEALHLIFLMETTRCLSEAKTIPPSPQLFESLAQSAGFFIFKASQACLDEP